jgi:hypothetical protein
MTLTILRLLSDSNRPAGPLWAGTREPRAPRAARRLEPTMSAAQIPDARSLLLGSLVTILEALERVTCHRQARTSPEMASTAFRLLLDSLIPVPRKNEGIGNPVLEPNQAGPRYNELPIP